jgi:hypothetical protein
MLVTSDGQWVLEDSAEFLAALGDPNPDYDAASFAVKNLGFIKFQVLDGSIVEIELHPRNVQLPALLGVQQQLLSCQVRLFRIKYFDMAWHSEIMTSVTPTISRLSELCAREAAPPPSDRFLVEPQDYSQLFRQRENPLVFMICHQASASFPHGDRRRETACRRAGIPVHRRRARELARHPRASARDRRKARKPAG